jgi:hypothetical protein
VKLWWLRTLAAEHYPQIPRGALLGGVELLERELGDGRDVAGRGRRTGIRHRAGSAVRVQYEVELPVIGATSIWQGVYVAEEGVHACRMSETFRSLSFACTCISFICILVSFSVHE